MTTTSCTVFSWQPVLDNFDGTHQSEKSRKVLSISIKRSFEKQTNIAEDWRKSHKERVLSSSDWEFEVLRKTFEKSVPAKVTIDETLSGRDQRFVIITLYYDYEASYSHKGWCEASWMTGGIIPCWGDLSVHFVEYELYKEKGLQRKYVYRYARKGAWWIGLLPFVWLNFFTNSQEDALASTARQFLIEAGADELL